MILVVDMNAEENSLSFMEFVLPILRILDGLGQPHHVVHYRTLNRELLNGADAVILSGTPLMDNAYYDHVEEFSWLRGVEVPMLGICAGMQFIGIINGAETHQCLEIGMTVIHVISPEPSSSIFPSAEFEAYDLHRYALLPSPQLEVLAESDSAMQAYRVKGKNTFGVLFHPEVRNPEVIEKFVENHCMRNM